MLYKTEWKLNNPVAEDYLSQPSFAKCWSQLGTVPAITITAEGNPALPSPLHQKQTPQTDSHTTSNMGLWLTNLI